MVDVKEVFDLYDTEGENYIKAGDLGNVLRAVGHNPSESELQDILAQVDTGSGKLTFNEVKAAVSNFPSVDYRSQVSEAFKVFDKDGKGQISPAELTHIMCNLGEKMTQAEVEEMLREAGLSGSAGISEQQFISAMLAAP